MAVDNHHHAHVDAFLSAGLGHAPPERLIAALDVAFAMLWRRAQPALGDVTLAAILDRVLHTTIDRFPSLWSLEPVATGLRVQRLRERADTVTRDELLGGIRFLLVEFLTVLGNLTANILTPAMHAELAELARHQTHAGDETARPKAPINDRADDEGSTQ